MIMIFVILKIIIKKMCYNEYLYIFLKSLYIKNCKEKIFKRVGWLCYFKMVILFGIDFLNFYLKI